MYQATQDFLWYKKKQIVQDEQVKSNWIEAGLVIEIKEQLPNPAEPKFEELDINKDGKVDHKDVSLAGKVLSKISKKKQKRKWGNKWKDLSYFYFLYF